MYSSGCGASAMAAKEQQHWISLHRQNKLQIIQRNINKFACVVVTCCIAHERIPMERANPDYMHNKIPTMIMMCMTDAKGFNDFGVCLSQKVAVLVLANLGRSILDIYLIL